MTSTFKIEFECDNAAFSEYPQAECVRILNDITDKLTYNGQTDGIIFDVNGNRIGQWCLDMVED